MIAWGMKALRRATTAFEPQPPLPPGVVDWKRERTYQLWFERRDALKRIPEVADRWKLDEPERLLLAKWVVDGYFTLPDVFDPSDIDAYAQDVDGAWFAEHPVDGLAIYDVVVDGVAIGRITHSDLLKLPVEARTKAKEASNWRIMEMHSHNETAWRIFNDERAIRICSAIFDRPAVPRYSLTFSKGSRQSLHQDACVFHTWPMSALIGAWVALEDIKPGSGPLVYYPKSHREPIFSEFDNYPQTQARTSPRDQSDRYQEHVNSVASRYERKEFLAKKGEVLFWHGMLVHGGADYVAPGSTRKSFVIHYMPDGADVSDRIQGPFNW